MFVTRRIRHNNQVRISRAVANFCDPSTYPSVEEAEAVVQSGHAVTVGIHPKHAVSFSEESFAEFQALCAHPAVTGIGEVGIDHSTNSSTWRFQHLVLDRALDVLEQRHVLVLHCRSPEGSDEAFYPLMCHLKGRVDQTQRIHLHCFQGGIRTLRDWSQHFPNTYFGFTRAVVTFDRSQQEALRSVPDDRLLLESDAPYFPWPGHTRSTPSYLGRLAHEVAQVRSVDPRHILELSVQNVETLYFPVQ